MPPKGKISRAISFENALRGIGKSARLKAFRRRRPVAVSIEGQAFLIYPDGRRVIITPQLLRDLRNGNA